MNELRRIANCLRSRLQYRRRIHAVDLRANQASSITDNDKYRHFCGRAATDDVTFRTFRRNPACIEVLEHVGCEDAAHALKLIARQPLYLDRLEVWRRNDRLGSPQTEQFGRFGEWAPTTLRYLKVLTDIETLFGDLGGLHVVEIGAGYGGQCRLLLARFPSISYTIIDLPEPGALARRYLSAFGIDNVSIRDPADGIERAPDLLISNYALSEIRKPHQESYIASVVSCAPRGYMLWNNAASARTTRKTMAAAEQPMSAAEVAAAIPGAVALTSAEWLLPSDILNENELIIWGC